MSTPSYTDRDFNVLETIGAYGALMAQHLSTLFFWTDGKIGQLSPAKWKPIPHSNCQLRLKLLTEAGYLHAIEQPTIRKQGSRPYIYILTSKGARALAERKGCEVQDLAWRRISKDTSTLFLEHLLWINSARVALTYAAQVSARKASIDLWMDDAQLKREHSKLKIDGKPIMIPDGYFVLYADKPAPFTYFAFIECDRGSESGIATAPERNSWEHKIKQYLRFFESGMFSEHYQAPQGRVLTITTTPKRMANLKAITEKAGGKSRFLFTTYDQIQPVLKDPTSPLLHTILTKPIWEKAGKEGKFTFWLD